MAGMSGVAGQGQMAVGRSVLPWLLVAWLAGLARLVAATDGSLWAIDHYDSGAVLPVVVEATGVVAGSAGWAHLLFVKSDGSLWAMGYNGEGQLGDATTTNRSSPVQVISGGVATAVAGEWHSLFLKDDGSLWAMGNNWAGQLGDGTTTHTSSPVRIVSSGVKAVAAGVGHTLFVKDDGSLWAMGANAQGQLGDGTTLNRASPVQIVSGHVKEVAAGDEHSLFVKDDGSLWAMGNNGAGQLGDGTTVTRVSPVQVVSSGTVAAAAGVAHSLFIKDDGSLWAMGRNWAGQLGDGTTEARWSPVQVRSSGVTAAAAGADRSLFVRDDGSLWAMGRKLGGHLGDGTGTGSLTPVQVVPSGASAVAAGSGESLFVAQVGTGTVQVQVTPATAPWSVTDSAGAVHAGTGTTTLTGIPAGRAMVTWGTLPGYAAPSVASGPRMLWGDTVTFAGSYTALPKKYLAQITETYSNRPMKVVIGDGDEEAIETISGAFSIKGSVSLEWMHDPTSVGEATQFSFRWGNYSFAGKLGSFAEGLGEYGKGSCKFKKGKGKATVYESANISQTGKPKLLKVQTITVSSNTKTLTFTITGKMRRTKDMDQQVGDFALAGSASDNVTDDRGNVEMETTAHLQLDDTALDIPVTVKGKCKQKEVPIVTNGELYDYTRTDVSLRGKFQKK